MLGVTASPAPLLNDEILDEILILYVQNPEYRVHLTRLI